MGNLPMNRPYTHQSHLPRMERCGKRGSPESGRKPSSPSGHSQESSRKEPFQWWKNNSYGVGDGAWRGL